MGRHRRRLSIMAYRRRSGYGGYRRAYISRANAIGISGGVGDIGGGDQIINRQSARVLSPRRFQSRAWGDPRLQHEPQGPARNHIAIQHQHLRSSHGGALNYIIQSGHS